MTDNRIPISVGANVSVLTSLILKLGIGTATEKETQSILDSFGGGTADEARVRLANYFKQGDGILIADCANGNEVKPSEFLICPHDSPHGMPTIARHGEAHVHGAFPCFPHGFWPPNHREWESPRVDAGKITVGFCGMPRPKIRERAIEVVMDWCGQVSDASCDIITRTEFMGKGIKTARAEYLANMERNVYQLVARGVGNFSYRLYETLSFGRIPIIVGDHTLPNIGADWGAISVLADTPEEIPDAVTRFHREGKAEFSLHVARNVWKFWLSPVGWWAIVGEKLLRRQWLKMKGDQDAS